MYRLGVDVGGTNTDFVLYDESSGQQFVEKLPSTLSNPAIAILEGVERFIARGVPTREIGFFAHGTTVTTNALLQMKVCVSDCSSPKVLPERSAA